MRIASRNRRSVAGRVAERSSPHSRLNAIAALDLEMDEGGGSASAARVGGIITHFFIKPPSEHA